MNLQNNMVPMLFLGSAIAFLSPVVLKVIVALYYRMKMEYDYAKNPSIIAYSEARACIEPHKWTLLTLALRELPPGKYQACLTCGTLTGNTDVMLSSKVMIQVREKLELATKRVELENEITERVDQITRSNYDKYIAKEFPDEYQSLVYRTKLRALVEFGFTAREEAVKKVEAELKAQTDLEARYKDWPVRRKGNA